MIRTEPGLYIAECICWAEIRLITDDKKNLAIEMKARKWKYDKEQKQAYCPNHEKAES